MWLYKAIVCNRGKGLDLFLKSLCSNASKSLQTHTSIIKMRIQHLISRVIRLIHLHRNIWIQSSRQKNKQTKKSNPNQKKPKQKHQKTHTDNPQNPQNKNAQNMACVPRFRNIPIAAFGQCLVNSQFILEASCQ